MTEQDFSVERAMLNFFESKPKYEAYDYRSTHDCAVAQYLKTQGYDNPGSQIVFNDYSKIAHAAASVEPHTFGGLSLRLRRTLHLRTDPSEAS